MVPGSLCSNRQERFQNPELITVTLPLEGNILSFLVVRVNNNFSTTGVYSISKIVSGLG